MMERDHLIFQIIILRVFDFDKNVSPYIYSMDNFYKLFLHTIINLILKKVILHTFFNDKNLEIITKSA